VTVSDGQREQLAAAVPVEVWRNVSPTLLLDALLPVVQRIADQRAAQALREAADAIYVDSGDRYEDRVRIVMHLRNRADALDPS
jgi:hypothetical protein